MAISPCDVRSAGWSEKERDLIRDAQLWLRGTNDQVTFPIIVTFTENTDLRVELPDDRKFIGTDRLCNGNMIECLGEDGPEASSSDIHALAFKLRELEERGTLMKPLLGNIEARMRVFRKVREGDSLTRVISSVDSDSRVFLAHDAKVFPVANSTITKKTSRQI